MSKSKRNTFEGREVIGTELSVAGATADVVDGEDPFQVGDIVFLVCEAIVQKVTHKAVKDSDKLVRVTSARSLVGAIVDGGLVRDAIDLAHINAEAKDGIQRLGLADGDA